MTRIKVQAGQSMLESYVKKPAVGLCELIWNAFDEDAEKVEVSIVQPEASAPGTCVDIGRVG